MRIALYAGSFFALTATYTWLYQWGMATLEGEPRTLIHSLEVVVQSMTTTGYGQDAPWESAEMTVLMMVIQLSGIAYIFVAIPLFVVPWLRDIVAASPPESVDRLSDHVVIVGYTDLCESLVDELSARDTPYLIVEADDDRARTLHERDRPVLHADPTDETIIEAASVDTATAVVVGSAEDEYIRAVLTITDHAPDAMIVALIETADRARYLRYAGVDQVLFPSHRLGKVLGDKVREIIITEFDVAGLTDAIEIREYTIPTQSDLFDEPLADCRRLESTNATLLGAWVRGDLLSTLSAAVHTDRTTRLLVAGLSADHEAVADIVGRAGRRYQPATQVIVVGAGLVGEIVTGVLERAGIETTVVDCHAGPLVDIVGDGAEETVLDDAGIETADSLIITLAETAAIDTTLVARALNTDLEIIVAAEHTSEVDGLRIAGANYVLALPSIAGRMLSQTVFERAVMPLNDRIRLVVIDADRLVDASLSARLREETGCAIVARERDGEVETVSEIESVAPGEQLIVAGTDREIDQFAEQYLVDE